MELGSHERKRWDGNPCLLSPLVDDLTSPSTRPELPFCPPKRCASEETGSFNWWGILRVKKDIFHGSDERHSLKPFFVVSFLKKPKNSPQNGCPNKRVSSGSTQILWNYHLDAKKKHGTFPTSNGGMQKGSSVGMCTHCIHVFAHLALICMLSRCLGTKFPHRSSGGSLLRVSCWLGYKSLQRNEGFFFRISGWVGFFCLFNDSGPC